MSTTYYELRFRNQFLEAKGTAFQELFVAIMTKAHPEDFIACRPWGRQGDRKNDGYLKSQRTLFQVYAPLEMRVRDTVSKIHEDFAEALPHWREHFDTWAFVHNSDGGLPPDVIAALLALQQANQQIRVTHWGFQELLQKLRVLRREDLRLLYGEPPADSADRASDPRHRIKVAQGLLRDGKHSEAIAEMSAALNAARDASNIDDEVEILSGLALLRRPHDRSGDHLEHLSQAERKLSGVKSPLVRIIYLRARASALQDDRDAQGAEVLLREALKLCITSPDDDKGNLATQGCVIRASLVHHLCSTKRLEEARILLDECEAHARTKDRERTEVLQAALEAGIHLALETGDEEAAATRIAELEAAAKTGQLASQLGGDLTNIANRASHREAHSVALLAAQSAVRLAHRCADSVPAFLPGALYTEAMVIMKAGNDAEALVKAEAILDLCNAPDDAPIRYAVQHLIAEIRRVTGDAQAAVDLARRALALVTGGPENVAFAKLALARALNDNGETEEALKQAREAWILARPTGIPPVPALDFIGAISNYASQLGDNDIVQEVERTLASLEDDSEKFNTERTRIRARADANERIRGRLLEAFQERIPEDMQDTTRCASLSEANAVVMRTLVGLWDEAGHEAAAGLYDFWGRGNFTWLLHNTRAFPRSFNITLEVRTLEDVKRAIRLWSLYSDFLVLLWKGALTNGVGIVPFPEDYGAPGGWGYMIAAGSVLKLEGSRKKWYPAFGHISTLPDEVARFLATEARPFVQSGRLIVVPAVAVGCVNPGHGPFEQLLAEMAHAVPGVRWKNHGTPIGLFPHSPDAPFQVLAELAEQEADRLKKLRLLLAQRSVHMTAGGSIDADTRALSLEIDDALRELDDRHKAFARENRLHTSNEPIADATAPFRHGGRAMSDVGPHAAFAPLFVLETLGYGWRVDGPAIPRVSARFEPQAGDLVGSWLVPPSAGWTIPTVVSESPRS